VTQILKKTLIEATLHQGTGRRVTVTNWNGAEKFLLIEHLHISLWEYEVD
jgi:hypothetical protein